MLHIHGAHLSSHYTVYVQQLQRMTRFKSVFLNQAKAKCNSGSILQCSCVYLLTITHSRTTHPPPPPRPAYAEQIKQRSTVEIADSYLGFLSLPPSLSLLYLLPQSAGRELTWGWSLIFFFFFLILNLRLCLLTTLCVSACVYMCCLYIIDSVYIGFGVYTYIHALCLIVIWLFKVRTL